MFGVSAVPGEKCPARHQRDRGIAPNREQRHCQRAGGHCLLPGSSGALPSGGNSSSNCLARKGYLLLGWDRATRFPCCFCPHDHPCFVCSLSASADTHKASTESGGVLLRLCPRHTAPARWALAEGRPSLLSDLLEAPAQGQQLNRAGTGRGHSKPLSWLLVSSPVL